MLSSVKLRAPRGSISRYGLVLAKENGGSDLCFVTGDKPLPSDVKPDPKVRCIKDSKAFESIDKLPDVEMGDAPLIARFTAISFLKDTKVSSVRFAINNFPIKLDREYIANALAVYTAINAGLRSLGDRPNSALLASLKGVAFFLEFQLRCKDGDIFGVQGAKHKLLKTLKNCLDCTEADKKDLKILGAQYKITGV